MVQESVVKLLGNLSVNDPNLVKNLELIETLLKEKDFVRSDAVELLPLDILFQLCTPDDDYQLKLCCSIIRMVLGEMDVQVLIPTYKETMAESLRHPSAKVRSLVVDQIERMVKAQDIDFVLENDLLHSGLLLIADESFEVVNSSQKLFISCCSSAEYKTIFSCDFVKNLMDTMSNDDIVRFRVYDSICDSAKLSPVLFAYFYKKTGLLDGFVEDVKSNDPLIAANVIQLLSKMCSYDGCQTFIDENDVFGKVAGIVQDTQSPFAGLVIPFGLRFYGNIAQSSNRMSFVDLFAKYKLHSAFLNCLKSDDNIKLATLQSLQLIVSNPSGLLAFSHSRELATATFSLLHSLNFDLRNCCLHVISSVFSNVETEENKDDLNIVYQYLMGIPKVKSILIDMGKHPFDDSRYAVYRVLLSFSKHPWASKDLINDTDFMTFIVDRSIEKELQGQKYKFDIVTNLTMTCATLNNSHAMEQLLNYTEEGAFQKVAGVAIGLESAQ